MKTYLIDANVLIQAHQSSYPFDVIPSYWKTLKDLSDKGIIKSIDKVKMEICGHDYEDDLSTWCKTDLDVSFFCDTQDCINEYNEITQWAMSNTLYTSSAKSGFLKTDLADPWLIAYSMKNNCNIVTYEISDPYRKKSIKIPEPCKVFGVKVLQPIDMLRMLNISI